MVSLFLRSVDKIVYGDYSKKNRDKGYFYFDITSIFIEGNDYAEQQINEVYWLW